MGKLENIVLLLVTAFFAGALNAAAGGGSFLTFPALVYAGVPPIIANATSTASLLPGYVSSVIPFWGDIRHYQPRQLLGFTTLSAIGGVIGALLLLVTSNETFSAIVPWLLLVATLVFAFGEKAKRFLAADGQERPVVMCVGIFLVSVYGGYFNGGLGIMLLALFAAAGLHNIHIMNGLKNFLSVVLTAISVAAFAFAGIIEWKAALIMAVAATIGGYVGGHGARRIPKPVLKAGIVLVGLVMTMIFFSRV
ncbi:MAG: sulfite exporter TauE/SafE family protein [Phyllobacterium sp.]